MSGGVVVLGAGIAGLAAARAAERAGHSPTLVEGALSVGGLTRSITVSEYCFDYTGHLLHLSRCGSPAGVPLAGLRDDEWQRVERRSALLVRDSLVPAPVQYNLGALAPGVRDAFLRSYEERPHDESSPGMTFRDFLVRGFGSALAEEVLIPQNEKSLSTDLARLSLEAVKRFFPAPDPVRIRAGLDPVQPAPPEYNSQFWYPVEGGIQRLVHGLQSGLERPPVLGAAVERVELAQRVIHTRNGGRFAWERLFSSIPLPILCTLSDDADLRSWARELTCSSTVTFNLGFRRPLPPALFGVHWVYVPDKGLPFYRVGFYSNLSAGMCPAGTSSAYVEVGRPGATVAGHDLVGALQVEVLDGLERLGWVRRTDIACCVAHVLRHAYVHHTPGRAEVMPRILERLREHGVEPIGRYGLWDYTSMEDCILSSIAAVEAHLT